MDPHKCPICEGHGIVSAGFFIRPPEVIEYASTHTTEECRVCNGTGIIWSKEAPE